MKNKETSLLSDPEEFKKNFLPETSIKTTDITDLVSQEVLDTMKPSLEITQILNLISTLQTSKDFIREQYVILDYLEDSLVMEQVIKIINTNPQILYSLDSKFLKAIFNFDPKYIAKRILEI